MKNLLTILFLIFAINCFSQKEDLPRNPVPGKCYQRCPFEDFKYDKKFKGSPWIEVSCDSIKRGEIKVHKLSVNQIKSRVKFKKYQEKLIALGYNFKPNNFITKRFIKAHNKYIRKKKRAAKKRLQNKV